MSNQSSPTRTQLPSSNATTHYHQGHDVKSLLLNLTTILIFGIPIIMFVYGYTSDLMRQYTIGTVSVLLMTGFIPPMGFYRPHPYSDWPWNKPLQWSRTSSNKSKNS